MAKWEIYLIVLLAGATSILGYGAWRESVGVERGELKERAAWEAKAAANQAAEDSRKAAVAKQAETDASAVAAWAGPLMQALAKSKANTGVPPKIELVFDDKCKVSAKVVGESNVGR
jgi:hypothetical protein